MKFIMTIAKVFRKKKREDVQYYDHYTMLGTALGSYCSLIRFGGEKRN